MPESERDLFTVGVFQDVAWAERGVEALTRQGFDPASLSVVARESPDVAAFCGRVTGPAPDRLDLPGVGAALVRGELVRVLQGEGRDLGKIGLAAAMRRVGFQAHDGLIYQTLTERGGILVAVHGAPRAADALATMLSFGGGNAAIGAWGARV